MIGAEIFIEPGQTEAETETWFQRLQAHHLTVTRIRMFESYMHQPGGSWDFSLFDRAFILAGKYGIRVYANLFPATDFTDIGGFKFPDDEAHLQRIALYIEQVVNHFKDFPALYGWVPVNEPGAGKLPQSPLTGQKFAAWKQQQPDTLYNDLGYPYLHFDEERFLLDHNTWFLAWLTDEIRKYDPHKPIHVNNHQIFSNVAEYDFPAWRSFLSSLGGSAHPGWHFGYFNRSEYALAVSANSEIIRSGAGTIPWFMTELTGGNMTYSGSRDIFCPTQEEISQWLWACLATESKGAIFWCLNPRMSGMEAGEWAMLNYQNEPSDRMQAAGEIAGLVNTHADLFACARTDESGIHILYTRESLWIEARFSPVDASDEARRPGGVMQSALAYFETLSQLGVQANLKEIREFDFSKDSYRNQALILPHTIALPSSYWQSIVHFVAKGGKLIADGLTGYYNEHAFCILKACPLQELLGGRVSEFKYTANRFTVTFNQPPVSLPAHAWLGTIRPDTGTVVATYHDVPIALRNRYGDGEVFWTTALLGLGARIERNYRPLAALLEQETAEILQQVSFRFREFQKGMLMKTLVSGSTYITVIINKSGEQRTAEVLVRPPYGNNRIFYANKGGSIQGTIITIYPEETLVVEWG
ncbi:hypothetical protein FW774_05050 (plasmid) [Pedobacter sp. BS3]|uniref:beta-galactosidase trimerization domain-containing protein n=1 Tax=Pedobacter sp. BS3 TaxID=2567937 RepID=UPI0011EE316A|nr:beta-galactosidase trimerization domain-containing protein [Pedobacter sp. BS3]TZF86415.1 hypothetical protein FW774_05050 [Pedobacter sp. BS3]